MKRSIFVPSPPSRKVLRRNYTQGMSLVEVLVAILLFSIGALTVMAMTTMSFRSNSNAYAVDESANLARSHMDYLLSLDYDHGQLQDTNADGSAGLLADDAVAADYNTVDGRYLVTWNIAGNVPVNGAKTVAVIVGWQGSDRARRVVFQTIKSE